MYFTARFSIGSDTYIVFLALLQFLDLVRGLLSTCIFGLYTFSEFLVSTVLYLYLLDFLEVLFADLLPFNSS